MISHKHRFIYIGIPKSGSVTLRQYLRKEAAGVAVNYRYRIPILTSHGKKGKISLIAFYPDYFVFSFVRNPFDRFLSFFLHGARVVRVVRKNRRLLFYEAKGDLVLRDCDCLLPPYRSLEECAEKTQQRLWNLKEDQIIGQSKYTRLQLEFERWHSLEQSHFLLDIHPPVDKRRSCLAGTPCSFIGRVENFHQDLSALSSILGLPRLSVKKFNVADERTVQGKRRHYSAYYTKRARTLVEEIYARDLELLGYEFEDEMRTSLPVSLYNKNQPRKIREEKIPPYRRLGFKMFILRLCYPDRKFIELAIRRVLFAPVRILYRLKRRKPILKWLYHNLYRPLKFYFKGIPLVRNKR